MACTKILAAALLSVLLTMPVRPSLATGPGEDGPTPLEEDYARRSGEPLSLFGYETFSVPPGSSAPPLGAVQDDHRLGIGDELSVILRGEGASSTRHRVGTDGLVTVGPLRPVAAAGRTLGEFKAALEAEAAARLPQAEVFVTLTALRRISVLVMGAVARPGRVEVSGQSTVLDGLLAAGGVTRHGSLRRIRLVSGAGTRETGTREVDLYDLLADGSGGATERLRDGDRIVVPLLGPTAAVAGAVRRPGIYELGDGPDGATAADVLALAGGPLHPGPRTVLRLTFGPEGEENTLDVGGAGATALQDGDILVVKTVRGERRGAVLVDGRVAAPGLRPLEAAASLGTLLELAGPLPDAYLPFAVLQRTDDAGGTRTLVAVDLAAVRAGTYDLALADEDTLMVFGPEDVAFLTAGPVLDLVSGRRRAGAPACAGLTVLARRLASGLPSPLSTAPPGRLAGDLVPSGTPCPPLLDRYPDVLSFALDHAVLMRAGVPRPGFYPVAGTAAIASLARAAGAAGPAPDLAVSMATMPAAADGFVRPGDVVEPAQPGYELAGHVRHPGWRRHAPGTTLRDALGDGTTMKDGVYPLAAAIDRFDRSVLARRIVTFAPAAVIEGRFDLRLEAEDRIVLFSAEDVRRAEPDAPLPGDPGIAAALVERVVEIRGAVRWPGRYPVAGPVALDALIRQAGGFASDADPASIDVTTMLDETPHGSQGQARRTLDLRLPGAGLDTIEAPAVIRIRRRDGHPVRTVSVHGEVGHPGDYEIVAGETLSSLLDRAGGLTGQAYPAGTVFLREANRRQEADGFARTASEIDRSLALALAGESPPSAGEVEALRRLAADLRSVRPLGRITVESDPEVLAAKPELDILLEAGDRIIVPQRPLTVTVSGEVLAPGHLGFVSGKTAADYIREAGGTTRDADDGRAFMILPDGSAQPLAVSFWNHDPAFVPPGATIVVPRDPEPFDLLEFSSGIGSVLGELARTAATITILSR